MAFGEREEEELEIGEPGIFSDEVALFLWRLKRGEEIGWGEGREEKNNNNKEKPTKLKII